MNNEISQYFSKSDGSTIATDNDLKSLSIGTVVKNINSKESYKKIAVNVFDKQNDNLTTDFKTRVEGTGEFVSNITWSAQSKTLVATKSPLKIDLSPYALKTDLNTVKTDLNNLKTEVGEIGKNTITITYGDGV